MIYRLRRLLAMPWNVLQARLAPASYAKAIGVKILGRVTIYGSSYEMFSTEPFLVTLHDNVFISIGAKFICHDGGVLPFRREFPKLDLAAPITVMPNVFIGMGAVILKGVTVGENSVVGAFAVVSRDVPPGSIVAGNPAQIVKSTEAFLESARRRSLQIGDLPPIPKEKEYRKIFDV